MILLLLVLVKGVDSSNILYKLMAVVHVACQGSNGGDGFGNSGDGDRCYVKYTGWWKW